MRKSAKRFSARIPFLTLEAITFMTLDKVQGHRDLAGS